MSISEKANDLLNKFCGAQYDYVVWSTQDNLVARDKARQEISDYIAKIETENAELKERVAMLDVSSVFKSLSEMSYIEQVAGLEAEYSALPARIVELEGEIDQLTAHDATERQDDKSSNDTQTQTIVYGKESEE